MTGEGTRDRPNIPCKLEIGQKFEFCVTDIHEIARRYTRIIPTTNTALQQFVVSTAVIDESLTTTYFNISVQPQSIYRGLFAAWAGSVKYRIFTDTVGRVQVMFSPFYNSQTLPGIPIIDASTGSYFSYKPDFSTVSITSDSALTGNVAREVMYPISGRSFIDVSAPFQTHFNNCFVFS